MLTRFENYGVVFSLQVIKLKTAVTRRTLMMTCSRFGRRGLIRGTLTDALELNQFVAPENVSNMDFGVCTEFIQTILDHLLILNYIQ